MITITRFYIPTEAAVQERSTKVIERSTKVIERSTEVIDRGRMANDSMRCVQSAVGNRGIA